jgi:long-subunit fatty acid transport protein
MDGRRARLDLPMVLRFGLGYQATPRLRASVGMNAYLEKSANFGMLALPSNRNDPRRDYGNTYEEAAALEYQAGPRWLLSAGVNFNQIGQAKASTLDISIPGAHADYLSLGAGFRYAVSERLKLNAGFGRTRFRKPYENADAMGDQKIQAALAGLGEAVQPHKVYDKRYFIVAFGLDYHFSW